jgi:hypothetical protein
MHDKCKDKQVLLRRARIGEITAQTLCRVFKYALIVKLDISDNPVAIPPSPCAHMIDHLLIFTPAPTDQRFWSGIASANI